MPKSIVVSILFLCLGLWILAWTRPELPLHGPKAVVIIAGVSLCFLIGVAGGVMYVVRTVRGPAK